MADEGNTAEEEMKNVTELRQEVSGRHCVSGAESISEGRVLQDRQEQMDRTMDWGRRDRVGDFLIRMTILGWLVAFLVIALGRVL